MTVAVLTVVSDVSDSEGRSLAGVMMTWMIGSTITSENQELLLNFIYRYLSWSTASSNLCFF